MFEAHKTAKEIIADLNKTLEAYVSIVIPRDTDLSAAIERGIQLQNQERLERGWYK